MDPTASSAHCKRLDVEFASIFSISKMGLKMISHGRVAAWLAAACLCAVTGARLFVGPSGRRLEMDQSTRVAAKMHHHQLRTFMLADETAASGGGGGGGGGDERDQGETLPYATLKILEKFKSVGAAVYAKKSSLSAGSAAWQSTRTASGGGAGGEAHSGASTAAGGPMPLPKPYDNDEMEMIGAMQKQDGMIVDQKEEAEERAKLGDKAPPLKPVRCGETCFASKGVWCCRM